jgi:hypothetical protein
VFTSSWQERDDSEKGREGEKEREGEGVKERS